MAEALRHNKTVSLSLLVVFVVLSVRPVVEAGSLVIRYDANGQVDWVRDNHDDSSAEKVSTDGSGNVFVSLYESALAIDWQGQLLWQQDFPMLIEDFVVTDNGYSYWDCSDGEACVVKLDPDGQPVWNAKLQGTSVVLFVLREDDTPYVLTYCNEVEENSRCLMRLSEDGEPMWTTWVEKPGQYDVAATSLHLGPDESVYVCGWLSQSSDQPGVVYRYDENGEMVWRTELDDARQPEVFAVDDEGNAYIPFGMDSINGEVGLYLKKLNAEGIEEWTQVHDLGTYHAVSAIDVNAQHQIAVASCDENGSSETARIAVFEPSGQQIWVTSLEEEVACFREIVIADDNSVFATGGICSEAEEQEHGCRMVTAKINSNGEFLWIAKHDSDHGDQEEGLDIDISGEGDVVVVGNYVTGSEDEDEDSAGCGC